MGGVFHGLHHPGVGRQGNDHLHARHHPVHELAVANVPHHQLHGQAFQVLRPAGHETVQHADLSPRAGNRPDEIGADKAGAAGDQVTFAQAHSAPLLKIFSAMRPRQGNPSIRLWGGKGQGPQVSFASPKIVDLPHLDPTALSGKSGPCRYCSGRPGQSEASPPAPLPSGNAAANPGRGAPCGRGCSNAPRPPGGGWECS